MADGVDYTWQQATNLAGKRVLLTGCASGIGRATAQLYAQAGAIVYGGDVNVEGGRSRRRRHSCGGRKGRVPASGPDAARTRSMRSSMPCARRRAARSTSSRASRASTSSSRFSRTTRLHWNLIINVNYLGPVRMIHRLLPSMIEAGGGGKIVTVASDAGRVGSSGETFYAGSKGAIIAFTKSLAREMARYRHQLQLRRAGPDGHAAVPRTPPSRSCRTR